MEASWFRGAIGNGDSNQNVFRGFLSILHIYIKIAVLVENTRVYQFVLRLVAGTLAVGFY
jgi:hypothetical protein